MENSFEKIGTIDYKGSKYASAFIICNFIFFVVLGVLFIILTGSASYNGVKGPWLLLGCLGYILLHEVIHLLFMKLFSSERLHVSVKFPTISVGSNGKFSKWEFIIIALAPVTILGVILIALAVLTARPYMFFFTVLLILNFAGSGGDYLQVFAMRKYPAGTYFQDNSKETVVYKKTNP